jgi:hypothetical protein
MGNVISLFPDGSMSGLGLTPACEAALYLKINCPSAASSLISTSYVGSFNNATLTSQVCAATCGTDIANLHQNISMSCGSTDGLLPGMPFVALVDIFWSNWNQSCFNDPTTGSNCNGENAVLPLFTL